MDRRAASDQPSIGGAGGAAMAARGLGNFGLAVGAGVFAALVVGACARVGAVADAGPGAVVAADGAADVGETATALDGAGGPDAVVVDLDADLGAPDLDATDSVSEIGDGAAQGDGLDGFTIMDAGDGADADAGQADSSDGFDADTVTDVVDAMVEVDGGAADVAEGSSSADIVALPFEVTTNSYTWTKMAAMKTARYRAHAAWGDGFLYVWGGRTKLVCGKDPKALPPYSDGYEGTIERYDVATSAWTPLPTPPVHPDAGGRMVWGGDRLYVYSAYPLWSGPTAWIEKPSSAAAYLPATGQWKALPESGGPGKRGAAAVVWIGDRLFVWGDAPNAPKVTQPGATYDPKTDSWTTLPLAPTITNENDGAWGANWNGERLSLWTVTTGLEFDPKTNSWFAFPAQPPNPGPTETWYTELCTSAPGGELCWFQGPLNKGGLYRRNNGQSTWVLLAQPPGDNAHEKTYLHSIGNTTCLGSLIDSLPAQGGTCANFTAQTWTFVPNPDPDFDRGDSAITVNDFGIYFVGGVGTAEKFYGQTWLWADGWFLKLNEGAKP